MKDRITFLDGHRGLAILLVIGYHAFSRWPTLIADDCCARFPLFALGSLGVDLFFLVSGFVILMTLERCQGALEFLRKRWLRLFPAMLICSLLIYCTAPLFHERPAGAPDAESLLPGWLFMDLSWTRLLLGHTIKPLEVSFWTLYVEVKFYVFAALVYYGFGRRSLIWALFGIALAQYLLTVAHLESDNRMLAALTAMGVDLGLENWFWFASGAAFHVHRQTGKSVWLQVALVAILAGSSSLGLPHHLPSRFGWPDFAGGILIGAAFALSTSSERLQRFLDSRILQFFGFISYPLYLLHENLLVALLVKSAAWVPRWLYPVAVLVALAPVAWLAWLIARRLEPALRKGLAWGLAEVARRWSATFGDARHAGADRP